MSSNDPIVAAALEVYSKAVRDGEARGYVDGYADARKHIIARLKSLVVDLEGETVDAIVKAHVDRVTEFIPSPRREPRTGSDQDAVLQIIRSHPGWRGVDIAARLHESVQERTVRTSLHRLKTRGLIETRDGTWWPVGNFQQEKEPQKIGDQPASTD
jgi:hypothetical protein